MAFQGILNYQQAGAVTESFLAQTNAAAQVNQSLIIIPLPPPATLQQQIAAATAHLSGTCKLPNGTPVTIDGNAIPIGTAIAIEMASCTPCNRS